MIISISPVWVIVNSTIHLKCILCSYIWQFIMNHRILEDQKFSGSNFHGH
uniref:Uncharacterized protein n=1 Tax=Arundo donax TaxID=35708 RepID=A0A0A8Z507_ARUDO